MEIPATAGPCDVCSRGWTPDGVGLVAGITAIACRGQDREDQIDRRSTVVLGLLFLFLGGTFAIEAATRNLWLALAGGTTGVVVARWSSTHASALQRGMCVTLNLRVVRSLHRVPEGLAVGTLSVQAQLSECSGAVAITGHTVLETGAVAGQYSSYRLDAIAAIGFVQLCYAGGAIGGVGLTATIPVTVQSASLVLAGGIFSLSARLKQETPTLSTIERM